MKKEYSYIEIVKMLDEILPATTCLDYTQVLPEELWAKVDNLLLTIGLKDDFLIKEIEVLKDSVLSIQRINYNKKTTVIQNSNQDKDYGFNQNNYWIKNKVFEIRKQIMDFIIDKSYFEYAMASTEGSAYGERIGNIEEIEDFIQPVRIRNYVTEILTMSKEKNDKYRLEPYMIVKEILTHYGIQKEEYNIDKVEQYLANVLTDTVIYINAHSESGRQPTVKEQEEKINTCINKISTCMERLTEICLNKSRQLQRKTETVVSQKIEQPQQSEKITEEKEVTEIKEYTVPERIEEKTIEKQEESTIPIKEINDMMGSYNRLYELVEKNRNMMEEIQQMEKRRIEIEAEIKKNNEELRNGIKYVI